MSTDLRTEQDAGEIEIRNLVCLGDTHFGCQLALCPEGTAKLDEGGWYEPSPLQRKLEPLWDEAWAWVRTACHGEPFAVLHLDELIDGVHHEATTQISHNLEDQARIAEVLMGPIVESLPIIGYRRDGNATVPVRAYWQLRGTDAHSGKSGYLTEQIAARLGAKPNAYGRFSRYRARIGLGKGLIHAVHHIGTTGSSAYEATAVYKEFVEEMTEAARSGRTPPNVVVRAHRHRHIETRVYTEFGYGISFVTAGWQLRTPFTSRMPGARISAPQIGISLIRQGDEDLYTRHKIWTIEQEEVERCAISTLIEDKELQKDLSFRAQAESGELLDWTSSWPSGSD